MKLNKLTSAVLVSASVLLLASCNDDDDKDKKSVDVAGCGGVSGATEMADQLDGKNVCKLSGVINEDITLTSDIYWALDGIVKIGDDSQKADQTKDTTLTIEAGTTVVAVTGQDVLVIARDGMIDAQGTAQDPIVMTHWNDIEKGDQFVESKGLWGGLAINGYAPSNQGPEADGEGNSGKYAGTKSDDNSGTLKYVVVKYPGQKFGTENELNGIAFQGVGSGTTVDYVQVHMSLDDGVEFFGGAVNAKHLVLTGNDDDSLDATHGYTGKLQYVYIEQNDSGDRGIEINSEEDDKMLPTTVSLPQTDVKIANLTVIAKSTNEDGDAVKFRARAMATIVNGYITSNDTKKDCLEAGSEGSVTATATVVSMCTANLTKGDVTYTDGEVEGTTANTTMTGKEVVVAGVTAVDASAVDAFFDVAQFTGAVGSTDWTAGWTVGL